MQNGAFPRTDRLWQAMPPLLLRTAEQEVFLVASQRRLRLPAKPRLCRARQLLRRTPGKQRLRLLGARTRTERLHRFSRSQTAADCHAPDERKNWLAIH